MEVYYEYPNLQPVIELNRGECFEYLNHVYIVMGLSDQMVQAVNLVDGTTKLFPKRGKVAKVEASVVVRR